jgi:hypothetical protein
MSTRAHARAVMRGPAALAMLVGAVALLGVALAAAGCSLPGSGTSPVKVPSEPAGITGAVKSVERTTQESSAGSMLVEGGEQPAGAVSDKAMVAFTGDTQIARAGRRIPPSDLEVGMRVRVWFEGPVAESYPVQGTASFIEVE